MENVKTKQWIKVISPALVYMLLYSTFTMIFKYMFSNSNLDILGDIELSIFVKSLSGLFMLPIVLVWYCAINNPIHIRKLASWHRYITLSMEIAVMAFSMAVAVTFIMNLVYGDLRDNSTAPIFKIIATGIVAPICEELIYRDVVFRRCNDYFGKTFAIIFSGILYGLLHTGSAMQIMIAVMVGMVLNLIYIHYHSVIVTILVHIGVNLLSFNKLLTVLPNWAMIVGFASLAVMLGILIYHYNDDKGRLKFKE